MLLFALQLLATELLILQLQQALTCQDHGLIANHHSVPLDLVAQFEHTVFAFSILHLLQASESLKPPLQYHASHLLSKCQMIWFSTSSCVLTLFHPTQMSHPL